MDFVLAAAKKIPAKIRKHIIEEKFIDKAHNITDDKTFEYLFDVYEEFIDMNGEFDDWTCGRCRAKVFSEWHKLKPYLERLESEAA